MALNKQKVYFYVRPSTSPGLPGTLYARVLFGKEYLTTSIKAVRMFCDEFDVRAQQPTIRCPKHEDIAKFMARMSEEACALFNDCQIRRREFTLQDLKAAAEKAYFQVNNPDLPYNYRTLPDVFVEHLDNQKKQVGSLISKGTYLLRERNIKKLNEVLVDLGFETMPVSYYETDHIEQIQLALLGKVKSKNYVGRMMQVLNGALKYAIKKKYITKDNPYEGLDKIRIDKTPNPLWLEPDELEAFTNIDLSDSPVAEKVRDAFVFCCWTGLAIGDYELLNPLTQEEQIMEANSPRFIQAGEIVQTRAGRLLMGRRKKTGTQYRVPILPEADAIINKYGGIEKLPFNLPGSGKILNLIGKAVGIKRKKLSFHCARKTKANYLINVARINPYYAIEIMGWKKIEEAAPYTRVSDETIASQVRPQTSTRVQIKDPIRAEQSIEPTVSGVFTIHRRGA